MPFKTSWQIDKKDDETIECEQKVDMEGVEEQVQNRYVFNKTGADSFQLELESEALGKVQGKCIVDENSISWEILGDIGSQGFETYRLQDNGEYTFHAEYASPDQFRTIIDGTLKKEK
jgi:hypothetical protein